MADPAGFPRRDGHAERMADGERRFQETKVRLERERLAHEVEFRRKEREYAAMKARGDRLRAGRSSPLRGGSAVEADDMMRTSREAVDEMVRKSHEDVERMARETRDDFERMAHESREDFERMIRETRAGTDEILWGHRFREQY